MILKGKRLLILGGTYNTRDIREYADEMGIVLVATGNNSNHPLVKISDEYYCADVYNSDQIVKLIREKKIDGVFVGGNEDIIFKIFDVIDQTNIFFYATREQWRITGNKKLLKQEFVKAGLPVVPEYILSSSPTIRELQTIPFPVVVKPVDGSGSKGVYLCENSNDVIENIPKTLHHSRSGQFIVERFMRGFIVVFYITVINDKCYAASMCDKYSPLASDGSNKMPTIAQVYLYPSRHLQSCLEKYFPAMEKLIHNLNIHDGVVGIQGFFEENDFFFTEIGYRLGGTSQQNYTKYLNNYSNMFLLMNYALTGKMTEEPCNENPFFNKTCGTLQLISKGGRVGRIEGVESVRNMVEVISLEQHYDIGDTIPVVDNVSMVHFRIFIVSNDIEHLKKSIRYIQTILKVYNDDDENMLMEDFDVDRLDTNY